MIDASRRSREEKKNGAVKRRLREDGGCRLIRENKGEMPISKNGHIRVS
jgi:hypothetical protein